MTMRVAALAGAIVLAATGGAHAQAGTGYEPEPVLNARTSPSPSCSRGPTSRSTRRSRSKGSSRTSPSARVSAFTAYGLRMLPIRVNEVEAIARLDEVSRTREFAAAMGRAAVRPVTSAVNMATRPVETVTGLPGGVTRLFGRVRLGAQRISQAATAPGQSAVERTADTSSRVGSVTVTALGFEQERRQLAERLGVDPYTTNPILSERLTNVAWAAFSGRFSIQAASAILMPYSLIMSGVSATNRAVFDVPPGDLINRATAIFRETGATTEQAQALMQNLQYSLTDLTALATGLDRLKGVPGRDDVVIFAAAAGAQVEVNFVVGAVNMLARSHESVAPLARIAAPGPIVGRTAAGALVVPAPVDYMSWIEPLGRLVGQPAFQAPQKVVVLSGQMSPLAEKNLTNRGWRIEQTFTTAAER